MGLTPTPGHGSLLKLRQFYSPKFASVYLAVNENQHCWEDACGGRLSRAGESVHLQSKLLVIWKPGLSGGHISIGGFLRRTDREHTLPFQSAKKDQYLLPCHDQSDNTQDKIA